jgi:PAS domain S-box-containing protein
MSQTDLLGNWIYNLATAELAWSAEVYQIAEVPEDQAPSFELLFRAIHPEDTANTKKTFNEALKNVQHASFEFRALRKNKDTRHILSIINILNNPSGTPSMMVGTLRDITQKRKEDIQLKENEERYRRLAEVTFEGIIITNQGKIMEANSAMAKLCGYEISELIGRSAFDILTPDSAKIMYQNIVAGYEKPYELEGYRKDGSFVPVEVCGRTVIYKGEAIRVASVRDISERRKGEDELRKLNENLENIVKERTNEVILQKEIIEVKNRDITDSILYAKKIQDALFAPVKHIHALFPESFILYHPKDIVSGDFYWIFSPSDNDLFFIGCCDCTGHGVPGAFMSLLSISFLNQAVKEKEMREPDKILNDVRSNIIKALNPDGTSDTKDGMDAVLCAFDLKNKILHAACANNPVWYIQNGKLKKILPDKIPVGSHTNMHQSFTKHSIQLQKGDSVYLFTDGYADQFGGPNNKKFRYKQLEETLLANVHLSMKEQKDILDKTFEEWKGNYEQVDDVLAIGIQI